jgi:mono/diheme cytochrome c family protein
MVDPEDAMPIVRLLLAVVMSLAAASLASAQETAELLARGHTLVATHCSRCHAIERAGSSPHRQAPPFRTLGQRYPIESLQEALAEGLSTGHPDMPEFVFEPSEINAILAYLQSIQVPMSDNRKDR